MASNVCCQFVIQQQPPCCVTPHVVPCCHSCQNKNTASLDDVVEACRKSSCCRQLDFPFGRARSCNVILLSLKFKHAIRHFELGPYLTLHFAECENLSTSLKVMSNKVHKNRLKSLNTLWQLMLNINFPSLPVVIQFRILCLPLRKVRHTKQ